MRLPLHIGVIGFGYWGPNIARVLSESKHVGKITICDISRDRLDNAQNLLPSCTVTDDISVILLDETINAVVIATPVATHFELAQQCLKHGKHILCEKPLSAISGEVDQTQKTLQPIKTGFSWWVMSLSFIRWCDICTTYY
jgi:predicted dehydrogenase